MQVDVAEDGDVDVIRYHLLGERELVWQVLDVCGAADPCAFDVEVPEEDLEIRVHLSGFLRHPFLPDLSSQFVCLLSWDVLSELFLDPLHDLFRV